MHWTVSSKTLCHFYLSAGCLLLALKDFSRHGSDVQKAKQWGAVVFMNLAQVVGLVQARLWKRLPPQGP